MVDNAEPAPISPDDPVDVAAGFFALAHAVKRLANARYTGLGLSMARMMALQELSLRGRCRMGELSDCLGVAARTMTSTVDGMVRDGLVVRRPDPADGRAVLVELTGAGRGALAEGTRVRDAVIAEIFATLDPDELARFGATVARLAGRAASRAAADHEQLAAADG
jgi:DNA-binding MarR family transcriptional regulator